MSQKPGFLDFGAIAWELETGFLRKSWWGCVNSGRNPVSWILGRSPGS
ncbi:MAG: hypothetical protein U7126_20135 [Microcoleus sp.]